MSIYDWLTISLICVAGATTPGPSLLVIVYINNREGMISGIIASIAHGIGIFIYALISIYAISFINTSLPTMTPILQLIGALFLIFISYKMIFFKSSKNIFQNNLQLSKKYSGSFLLGLTTSIINPKILILMGSTAMESLFGSKIKISKERGVWKDLIIHNKTYLTIITFHPAYLLRQAEQKKYSWADLKQIRKKIDELRISA